MMTPCQQCGGPIGAVVKGQTFTWTTTMTFDEDGALIGSEDHSGWCGGCIQGWNEAIGVGKIA